MGSGTPRRKARRPGDECCSRRRTGSTCGGERRPMSLLVLTGPDHRLVGTNAAYGAFNGSSDVIGVPYDEAFPGIEGQRLGGMLDRVYVARQTEHGREGG